MSAPRASTGRFVAGLVGLFLCSTMAWLLLWAAGASALHGSAPVLVASGSMGPSVRAGDLVVLEPYHSQDLTPGMVVRFQDPEGRGSILHRVVEVADDGSITTKGDANAVVDSSAVDHGRITGVGSVLVPRAALPVLWWRTGEWFALAVFAVVAVTAVSVTRYALLDAYDPWRGEPEPAPPRPPLPVAAREAIDRFRDEVARDGPVLVSRRVVLRRGAELTALGLAGAFLASSRTAWAAFSDTTANGTSTFGASTLTGPTGLSLVGAGCGGTSTVTQISSATTTGATGTSIVLDRPAGVQAGDLLVTQATFHTHDFTGTITAPAGWTTVRVDHDSSHVIQGVFWRMATASEPATYTFTSTTSLVSAGGQASGAVTVYRGVDPTSPIDAHAAGSSSAGSTSITAPSVTTTVTGSRLLMLIGLRARGPVTAPAGMLQRYEINSGNQNLAWMADQAIAAPGATGSRTATSANSGSWVAQAVALRPRQIDTVGSAVPASAPHGASGTLVLSRPAGVQAGDVLIAHVALHTHSFDANPIPAPSGWTLVRLDTDLNHVTSGVFRRVAGTSEPGTYTFINASGDTSRQAVGSVLAYRGVDPASPVEVHSGTTDTSGSDTLIAPSVTTTRPGGRLISFVAAFGTAPGPATPPGSMTERYEQFEGAPSTIGIVGEAADERLTSAGPTGTRSTSVSATDTSVAQAVALRPFTGESYADLTWTPSTSPAVDGYIIERRIGAVVDATTTVTPGTASSYTDGPLVAGTTYTYRVIATAGTWRSAPVTTTFTPAAC